MILDVKTAIYQASDVHEGAPRLDSFLAEQYSEYSRSFFADLIDRGLVLVNGAVQSKASYRMRQGDNVQVSFPAPTTYALTPEPVDFDIVAEHEDFIVINKPAGLVVHPPSADSTAITLVHGLLHRFADFASHSQEQRPGIVHRLDKDTSGLMIVARTLQSHAHITNLFKERRIEKRYLVVVHGHPPREGSIEFPISRCGHDPSKMTHRDRNGKAALTHYKVLEYYQEHALVEVHLVTGRTHQIRVHFAAIGHSVLGDAVYGTSSKLIKRQALHAWKISFAYNNAVYAYRQPVPADIVRVLAHLAR